jgi:hypothetical protein
MSDHLYTPPKTTSKVEGNAIPIWVYLICGWPLALVAVGGMIGGAMGGAAFGINLAIWKSAMPLPVKIILIPIVGFTAIGLWLVLSVGLSAVLRAPG